MNDITVNVTPQTFDTPRIAADAIVLAVTEEKLPMFIVGEFKPNYTVAIRKRLHKCGIGKEHVMFAFGEYHDGQVGLWVYKREKEAHRNFSRAKAKARKKVT